jgi:[FeFe] hydrogenase (group B1/B3)
MAMEARLENDIDRLPLDLYPRHKAGVRCCVPKDRAVTKYRLMSILGHRIEEEVDELKTLQEYAADAKARDTISGPVLTVLDEACSACLTGRHCVTNVCRGCVARPCTVNCPKDAIQMIEGRARIDESLCVDCGKCLKVCPYHAIVYVPVPCEDACPTGAIEKDGLNRVRIDYDKCIYCGKCMTACPFGAMMERSQIVDVVRHLNRAGTQVVAMLAPAIAGQFLVAFEKVASAIAQLGFEEVIEVAVGAKITAQKEAEEFTERMDGGRPFMTTSCCPAYTETVKKHIPELAPFVSDTRSPMYYTAQAVKAESPEAVTVFVGPCVAKRNEALKYKEVDYVLSVEELGALFVAAHIEISECEPTPFKRPGEQTGRGFPVTQGVSDAVRAHLADPETCHPVLVDGLDKKTLRMLGVYAKGKCPGNLVEVMGCQGGCVAGPSVIGKLAFAARAVAKLIETSMAQEA